MQSDLQKRRRALKGQSGFATRAIACALALVLLGAFSGTAPNPDGFTTETIATVPGLFARAVSYENQFELQDSLAAADKACIARGRILEYAGDTQNREGTTYWLYRSGEQTVVFTSRVTAHVEPEHCRVTFEEKREVRRSTGKATIWPSPFSGRLKCRKNCYSTTMLGIKARCHADGNGFQTMRDCVAIARGASRGMLLESVYESDDMGGSGFEVRELKDDAAIDASVFDPARTW
jgi:hypothetical protein